MAWTAADIPDQSGRTALVTGANGGLGLETARELARNGAHVVIAARDQDKAAAADADIRAGLPDASLEVVPLDLGRSGRVTAAARTVLAEHDRIDLLINNAGLMAAGAHHGRRLRDAARRQPPRPLGADRAAAAGRPRRAAPRVVTVTSTAHHMGRAIDPANPHLTASTGPGRRYGQSKLANFHFGIGLQREFEKAGARRRQPDRPPGPLEHRPAGADDARGRGRLLGRLLHTMTRAAA